MSSLKHKTISGVAWSSLERFSVQGIQFIIQIIMARILMPEDYGVVAMLAIFLAVFQTFIDSGFSSALVQKNDRSEIDYSTVFYFNIGISVALFLVFFFSAPLIAGFYNTPILTSVTKIVSLNLLINAFAIVPRAKLTVLIDFKTQAKASLTAVIISGAIGIWMAYSGFGVWALVYQSLLNNGINTLLLWILVKWWPTWAFSMASFKRLFSFGSKLLLSGLLDTVFRNLYTLVIGKKFTAQDLGYYSRADQFAQFPTTNITNIIWKVAMTVMCIEQNNDVLLKSMFDKFLRLSAYIVFPLMIGFAALAYPFVHLVLTEKWISIVPIMQILCFSYLWFPFHVINLSVLQAKGRSDLFLRVEIIKKILCVLILICTIPFGIIVMCIGIAVSSLLSLYINAYYTEKILDIGFGQQMKSIIPSFLLALVMGVFVFLFTKINLSSLLLLVAGTLLGLCFYIGGSIIFKMKAWVEMRALSIEYIEKFTNKIIK